MKKLLYSCLLLSVISLSQAPLLKAAEDGAANASEETLAESAAEIPNKVVGKATMWQRFTHRVKSLFGQDEGSKIMNTDQAYVKAPRARAEVTENLKSRLSDHLRKHGQSEYDRLRSKYEGDENSIKLLNNAAKDVGVNTNDFSPEDAKSFKPRSHIDRIVNAIKNFFGGKSRKSFDQSNADQK